MSTYVLSDIHGEYDKFMRMLEKIHFSDEDTLYVLGDVLDRGPHPMKILLEMMKYSNIIPMMGNHEVMGLPCLRFLLNEVTEDFVADLSKNPTMLNAFLDWTYNGCHTTVSEFRQLSPEEREMVLDYLGEFILYENFRVNGKYYVLVHGGLGGFDMEKRLEDYSIHDIVWTRPDYGKAYFNDIYVVTGHTPTQHIAGNDRPGYIYKKHNHIAIDCGACHPRGRLAAIRLDDWREYYVEK